jgi:hypothetical protein
MPLFQIRFEFSCFRVQVFIVYVGIFPQMACFIDKGERELRTSTQGNQLLEVNCKIQIVKSCRMNKVAFYSPCTFPKKESCLVTSV